MYPIVLDDINKKYSQLKSTKPFTQDLFLDFLYLFFFVPIFQDKRFQNIIYPIIGYPNKHQRKINDPICKYLLVLYQIYLDQLIQKKIIDQSSYIFKQWLEEREYFEKNYDEEIVDEETEDNVPVLKNVSNLEQELNFFDVPSEQEIQTCEQDFILVLNYLRKQNYTSENTQGYIMIDPSKGFEIQEDEVYLYPQTDDVKAKLSFKNPESVKAYDVIELSPLQGWLTEFLIRLLRRDTKCMTINDIAEKAF